MRHSQSSVSGVRDVRCAGVVTVLALLAAMSACSEEDGAAPSTVAGLSRAALEPLDAPDTPQRSRRVAMFEVPAELEPWTVLGGSMSVEVVEDVSQLHVAPGEQRRLSIPGPFDPTTFNRVVVHVLGSGARVAVNVVRGERVVARRSSKEVVPGATATAVTLDLPQLRRDPRPFDELVFSFLGGAPCTLIGVELRWEPPWTPLPNPWGDSQPIELSGEWRNGVGLTSAHPCFATIDVPERGRLGVSAGVPAGSRGPGVAHTLVAVIDPRGAAREHRFRLEPANDDRWMWFELDLADLEPGSEVDVEFELVVEGDDFGLCALGEPLLYSAREPSDPEPPTVLLITSDTHRADHLGIAGLGVELDTPNLDALAGRGILFEDCRSSTNVTLPSHAALLTGLPARDVGVYTNHEALAQAAPTLAERFRDAGFATFASTSNVSLLGWNGLGQGFDRAVCVPAPGGVPDAEQSVDALLDWLPEARDVPVFAWLHLFDAHHPYAPPEAYDRRYYPPDADPFDPELPDSGVADGLLPFDLQGLRDLSFPLAQYRAEISYLDAELGRLFDAPRLERAVIAFTSDHGELFGQGDIWCNHAGSYPDNLHVPLILAGEGVEPGLRVPRTVRQVDVGRTLLDLAGLERTDFPGTSLLDVIGAPPDPDAPTYSVAASARSASVTVGRFHLILALERHQGNALDTWGKHEFRLFDLEADPLCATDLVAGEPERTAELHALLVAWLRDARPESWVESVDLDDAALEHLAGLGYADQVPTAAGDGERVLFPLDCPCRRCAELAVD